MNQTEGAKLIQYIKIMIHTMKRPELIQMKKDDPIEFKRFMLENFIQLRDKSLTLFEMVLDKGENFDLPRFAKMMNLRDQVFENQSTTYEEASKKAVSALKNFATFALTIIYSAKFICCSFPWFWAIEGSGRMMI